MQGISFVPKLALERCWTHCFTSLLTASVTTLHVFKLLFECFNHMAHPRLEWASENLWQQQNICGNFPWSELQICELSFDALECVQKGRKERSFPKKCYKGKCSCGCFILLGTAHVQSAGAPKHMLTQAHYAWDHAEKSWLGPDFIQVDDPPGPERFRVRFLLKQARRTIIFRKLIHASEWISTC